MIQTIFAAPGNSIISAALDNGQLIRGVVVNNPSGTWLYLVSEKQFIPPYVLGWAMPLSYWQSAITILSVPVGPTGQVSTNDGDEWSVQIQDTPADLSTGGPTRPVIENFTPVVGIALNFTATFAGTTNFIPTPINFGTSRYRILMASVAYSEDSLFTKDSWQTVVLRPNPAGGGGFNVRLTLSGAAKIQDRMSFIPGLDWPQGSQIEVDAQSEWAAAELTLEMLAQII